MADPEIKKARLENNISSISSVNWIRTLAHCPQSKKIIFQARIAEEPGDAVVILEKTPISDEDFPGVLEESQPPKIYFKNDIYLSLCHYPKIDFTGLKTTLIYPATEQIIKKYTLEANRIINETADLYEQVTAPYITENHPAPEWLLNILDHKSEADRIIYEDSDKESGFILLPDLKWDGKTPEAFYVQALPHFRGLRTIRDLTKEHLPLLKKIAEIGPKVIEEKYKIAPSQLLIYFHYLPSFYHIHVHFKLIGVEGTSGTGCERAHLLSTVINNITIASDYYQKSTLPVSLKKSDQLMQKLVEFEPKTVE